MPTIRILAILVFLPNIAETQDKNAADLMRDVIRFEHPHDRFVRKLFGCPLTGEINDTNCNSALSSIDYADYAKARKAAAALYSLHD